MPSTVLIAVLLAVLSGATAPEEIVATYRGGQITTAEFAAWTAHRGAGTGSADSTRERLEELVLLRTLDVMFEERGLGAVPAHQARIDIMSWDQEAGWLRRRILDEAQPSEEQLRSEFENDPGLFNQPMRWRLENIFKRWPDDSGAARDELRLEMDTIRQRILDGEDFGELARDFSDSETRSRGGRLGTVQLDELVRPVADVVREMGPEALSPVIETSDGLTLIRCTEVLQAVESSFEDARDEIAKKLRRQRFDREWESLNARLRVESDPRYIPSAITGTAIPMTTVATVRTHDGRRPITLDDFRVFLRTRKVRRPAHELSAEILQDRLEERVLLEGQAQQAEAWGIASDSDFVEELGWKIKELRARIALDDEVNANQPINQPSLDELRALYSKRRAELVEPERLKLWALRIDISADRPAAYYTKVQRLGVELAEGRADFESASEALSPDAEKIDLGWMTRDQVWLMGRNVNQAVTALEPGSTSRAVQEGRKLFILHLEAVNEKRPLAFEEAEARLRSAVLRSRRTQADATVRRQLIDRQEITVRAADQEQTDGGGGR